MIFYFIIMSIIMEGMKIIYILINIGCLVYRIISFIFVREVGFECISIFIKKLIGIGEKEGCINKVVKVEIDIDRYK